MIYVSAVVYTSRCLFMLRLSVSELRCIFIYQRLCCPHSRDVNADCISKLGMSCFRVCHPVSWFIVSRESVPVTFLAMLSYAVPQNEGEYSVALYYIDAVEIFGSASCETIWEDSISLKKKYYLLTKRSIVCEYIVHLTGQEFYF